MSGIITAGINRSSGLMKAPASGGNTPSFMAVRGLDSCSGDNCRQAFNDATLENLIKKYLIQMVVTIHQILDSLQIKQGFTL